MCPTFYSCYTHPLMPILLYVPCLINVCSKLASRRASTTGRVCFKDVFGTISEGLRPSVNMQWNLSEVLLCAQVFFMCSVCKYSSCAVCANILHVQCVQIFFMCSVRIRLYRPNPIPTYNLNLFPSSLDMAYRMVTNFTLCPKKNE